MTARENRRNAPILRAASRRLRQLSLAAAPGDFLGSETELIELLGVSRPTFRQAVRLLEQDSLIAKRMGAKGGCYAARPDVSTLVRSASLVLRAADATLFDMIEVSSDLRDRAFTAAAAASAGSGDDLRAFLAAVDPVADAAEVPRFLEQERRFEQLIFDLADNPVLTLFSQILRRFVDEHPSSLAFIAQEPVRRLRAQSWLRVGAAVLDHDAAAAIALMREQNKMFRAFVPDESGEATIGEIAVDGPVTAI